MPARDVRAGSAAALGEATVAAPPSRWGLRPVSSVIGGGTPVPDSFVHLHNHTEYSMLDGAQKLRPMFGEVARQGMPA
ncbi:PHP domain-containing protein, partial [Streptomyces noursei]